MGYERRQPAGGKGGVRCPHVLVRAQWYEERTKVQCKVEEQDSVARSSGKTEQRKMANPQLSVSGKLFWW